MRIGLADLPGEVYISFGIKKNSNFSRSDKVLKKIVSDFKDNLSNIEKESKKLGIPKGLLFKILAGSKKKIRMEYLRKISEFLVKKGLKQYKLQNLEAIIYSVSLCHGKEIRPFLRKNGKIIRKFPFEFDSPEGVVCLTFPYGDGYISKDYSGHIRVGYTNLEKHLHNKVIRCVRETFGDVDYSTRKILGGWDTTFTGVIGRLYLLLGFKPGDKVKRNPSLIPLLKKLADRKWIIPFISQMVDDEGSFNLTQAIFHITIASGKALSPKEEMQVLNNYRDRSTKKYIPNILKEIKNILSRIGVTTNFRKPCPYFDRTKNCRKLVWHLTISRVKNLLIFRTICKPERKSLDLVFDKYCKKWVKILRILSDIERAKGYITVQDLAVKMNIQNKSSISFIAALIKSDMVELIKKGKYKVSCGKLVYKQSKYKLKIPKELNSLIYSNAVTKL